MNHFPKVAILYLSFHCEPYIGDVVSALKKMTYPKDRVEFVIVDNPHPKYGSSTPYLEDTVLPLSGVELPHVTLLPQKENLGFAGGNNVGIKWALENGFDYVYLHNNDGFVAQTFLEPLVTAMEADKTIGVAQSLVLMYPEAELVNTAGNKYHYLGMAYCGDFRVPKNNLELPPVKKVNYASGAACILRADLLKKFGAWDEDYFLYHEDVEYSYRLKAVGYSAAVVRDSVFFHKYAFGRTVEKYFFIERNRVGFLLSFYKWPTLLVLLPMLFIFDLGLVLFSLRRHWFSSKLRAYLYWLNPLNWGMWMKKRRYIQSIRTISDRQLLADAESVVIFDDSSVKNWLLTYIGNPLLAVYWRLAKTLISW